MNYFYISLRDFSKMQSTKVFSTFLTRKSLFQSSCFNQVNCYSTTKKVPIPVNKLKETFSANMQTENGAPYDKKPFKMPLEAGKKYSWCLCGKSKSQPICDGTHKDIFLKIKQRPIRFEVEETKEYWLCMCKQTKNRPFCDGAHKSQFVQDAVTKV